MSKAATKAATAIAIEHDKVTCSYQNLPAEIEKQVPDLDAIKRLSAGEVHQRLCDSFLGVAVNYSTAKNLIADAKRRMQGGEAVGSCKTWKSYVDTYLCKPDENLPAALRRLYRALDGEGVNMKHDGSKNRKAKQVKKQPATEQPVSEAVTQGAPQVQLQVAKNVTHAISIADKLAREVMNLNLPKHVMDLAKQYLETRGTE